MTRVTSGLPIFRVRRALPGLALPAISAAIAIAVIAGGASPRPGGARGARPRAGATGHRVAGRAAPATAELAAVPVGARAVVSATLGAAQQRFRVDRRHGILRAWGGGLSTSFTGAGAVVRAGGLRWRLAVGGPLRGLGGRLARIRPAAAAGSRVVYRAGAVEEWFANGPLGLEQGFTLRAPPRAGGAATVTVPVGRLPPGTRVRLAAGGGGATIAVGGQAVLSYGGLAIRDAGGGSLRGAIERVGRSLVIAVDLRGARYPVTIDPLLQSATLTSGDSGGALGSGAVAIDGGTIVAGAWQYPNGAKNGAAYVFVEPASGWADMTTYTARLTDAGAAAGDALGQSVGISGDTIVAGAHGNGYADVFVKPAAGWASTTTPTATLSDAAITGNTGFGHAVAIDGDTIAVGDPADSGADGLVDVYVRPAAGWDGGGTPPATDTVPTARLTDSTFSSGSAIEGELGTSVAVSGGTIAAGAVTWRANNTGAPQTGAVLVFAEPGGGWAAGGTSQHQVAVLTPGAASFSGSPELGAAVAIDQDTIVAGAPNWSGTAPAQNDIGAAYVYQEPAAGWTGATQDAVLTPSDGTAQESFGATVAVSGATVVAGAPFAGTNDTGAVYVFQRPASGWADATEGQKLTGTGSPSELGNAVAIAGGTVVAAADPGADGSLYLFGDQPLSVSAALPPGTVGTAYDASATAAGGTSPYTWSATGLPAGLTLDATSGAITGTPASAGSFPVGVTATDAYGQSATAQTTIAVSAPAGTTTTGTTTTRSGPSPSIVHAPTVAPASPHAGQTLSCTGDSFTGLGVPSVITATWFQKIPVLHSTTIFTVGQVASGRSYVVPDDTAGTGIYCEVQATAASGAVLTTDSNTVVVAATKPTLATLAMLVTHGNPAPAIDATLGTGSFNYCTTGAWQHHPTKYSYAWYIVPTLTAPVSSGKLLAVAQGTVITTAAEGGYLVCQVTAANSAGSTTALSNRYFVLEPDLGFTIDAMEVTQGIQTPELPTRVGLGTHVSYQGVPLPWSGGAPVRTLLAAGHTTVVRVYVTSTVPIGAHSAPAMTLSADANGQPLGTIAPDQVPPSSAIPLGPFTTKLAIAQRTNATGAYTFTLPPSWTDPPGGNVSFAAQLTSLPGTITCGVACIDRRTLTLGPEHFNQTTQVDIDQLGIVVYTGHGSCPGRGCYAPSGFPGIDPRWQQVQAETALPIEVRPTGVALDGTGIVNADSITAGFPCLTNCTHTHAGDLTDPNAPLYHWQLGQLEPMVTSWGDNNDDNTARYPFAMVTSAFASCCFNGGVTAGSTYNADVNLLGSTERILYGDAQPQSLSTDSRPFTGIAHELLHGLGFKHDDIGTCGGDANSNGGSENWTWPSDVAGEPANEGDLDGIGLDTSFVPSPYRIIDSPAVDPSAAQVWDLMSYCPKGTSSETNHWVAVRNWNREIAFAAPQPVSAVRTARPRATAGAAAATAAGVPGTAAAGGGLPATTAAAGSLAVSAVSEVGVPGALQLSVMPSTAGPTPPAAAGEYQLVGLDRAGQVVARAGATGTLLHVDGSEPDVLIAGRLPATDVAEVRVLDGGTELTDIKAAARPPAVRLLTPRRGATVGGRHGVTIRWRSRTDSGRPLQATVEYSPDGGHHWHAVYLGADRGHALLPSGFLSASRRARLRLYISDGFGVTVITSAPFTARGAPPSVSVADPTRGLRVQAGASVTLRAAAFDDTGAALRGRALVWRAGRTVIGHGTVTAAASLPAGRYRITVTARDRDGRTTVSSPVLVTVLPSPPVVTRMRAPSRTSSRAKRVTLKLSLLTAAQVTIGDQHWAVGSRPHALSVRVKPGRAPLVLVVHLRSGRYTGAFPVTIAR
jgi:hypothetical protein